MRPMMARGRIVVRGQRVCRSPASDAMEVGGSGASACQRGRLSRGPGLNAGVVGHEDVEVPIEGREWRQDGVFATSVASDRQGDGKDAGQTSNKFAATIVATSPAIPGKVGWDNTKC